MEEKNGTNKNLKNLPFGNIQRGDLFLFKKITTIQSIVVLFGAWGGNRTRMAEAEGFSYYYSFRYQINEINLFVVWTLSLPYQI
jgi:hypothetical protein